MAKKRKQEDRRSAEEEQKDGAKGGRKQRKKIKRSDNQARVVEQGPAEEQHPDVPGSSGGTGIAFSPRQSTFKQPIHVSGSGNISMNNPAGVTINMQPQGSVTPSKKRRQDEEQDEEQDEDGAKGGREQQKKKVRRSDNQARVGEQGLAEEQHPDVTGSSGGTDSQAREQFTPSNRAKVTDDELLGLSKRLNPNLFRPLGIKLGLTLEELEVIKADNSNDASNQILIMLGKWRSKQGQGDDARSLLVKSLASYEVGMKDLAEQLEKCRPPEAFPREESAADVCEDALKSVYKTTECRPVDTWQRASDRCEAALKEVYTDTGSFIPMIPWVGDDKRHIMDFYTKLLLIKGTSNPHWSQKVKQRERELKSYDEVLLKTKEGEAVKLTVFEGLPGRGKSTLFAKIAYDWATGSVPAMQGYKLVVLLKMNALEQKSDLVDAMFDQLLAEDVGIEKGDLRSYMEKNPAKVLILLDGFDELITTDLCQSSFGSILKILNRKQLRGCCAFVSTRLSHYDKLISEDLIQDPFTHVRVVGFSANEVREYVHRFYSEEHDQAEALLAKVRSTNIPSELTKSPMLLLLMCLLWRWDSNLPDTMSRLYSDAVEYIFRRKQRKGKISEEDVDTCVHEIGKVGLKGLLSPKQMLSFKEKDFEGNVFKLAIQAGILTSQKVLTKMDTHNSAQFIHKTFQEYCSGKYLQRLQVADTEEFCKILDQIMSQDPTKFGFLLRFCCGDSEVCTRTILQMFQERFPFELSAEDVVGNLALECYAEGQSEKVLDEEFVRLVIPTYLKVFEPSELTRFVKCVADQTKRHESDCLANVTEININGRFIMRQQVLPDLVNCMSEMTNLESLTFDHASFGLEQKDMTSTAEPVSEQPPPGDLPLSGVQFSGNTNQVWSELLKRLKTLHRLVLKACNLTGLDMKYIAEVLCSLPNFVELGVHGADLSGSGASWSIFLKEWKSLQKLWFRSCSLTGQDMKRITESLVNLPDLVELDVSENVLQGSLELWSENLKQLTNLKKLTLAKCSLSKQDVMHCTEAFSGLSNLEELDLSNNILHGSVALWSPRLQSLQQLQEIHLRDCSMTGEDVKHIVEAVRSLPNLRVLNLSSNDYLESSAALWSAELGSLNQLHHLYLHWCGLTEPDVEHIAKSLDDLPKLSVLDLYGNKFLGGSSNSWPIHLKDVKHLKLNHCFINEANLETFAQTLSCLTMLVQLNLSLNHMLGGSAKVWCKHFKHFNNLQTLKLSRCSLNAEDMKHVLQSFCSFPSLVELDLSENELTGSGALWGKQLELPISLQKLKLSGCSLHGDDMNHILEPPSRLPGLAEVDFSRNSLRGSAASWSDHLRHFSELRKLNFGGCDLTWNDRKHITGSLMIRQGKGLVVTFRYINS